MRSSKWRKGILMFLKEEMKSLHTRDVWNNLLHLFNISHFSSLCCAQNFRFQSCSTMAMRMQEQKEEEIIVAKSKLMAMNLSSSASASSSSAKDPIASKGPVKLVASGKLDARGKKKFKTWRSVEFSSEAARCTLWRVDG